MEVEQKAEDGDCTPYGHRQQLGAPPHPLSWAPDPSMMSAALASRRRRDFAGTSAPTGGIVAGGLWAGANLQAFSRAAALCAQGSPSFL